MFIRVLTCGLGLLVLLPACASQPENTPTNPPTAVPERVQPSVPEAVTPRADKLDAKTSEQAAENPTPPPVSPPVIAPVVTPVSTSFSPDPILTLCPRLTVRNAPASNPDRTVVGYKPFVRVENAVTLAAVPVRSACLTSGFGWRGMSFHKGVDLQSDPAQMVHSGAAGTVVEAGYRDDYGYHVVIDHGGGVYTRSAHLLSLQPGVDAGTALPFGAPLGLMGNTASYTIPIHLHYEVLIGDYNNPKAAFGLTPKSIFDYPYVDG